MSDSDVLADILNYDPQDDPTDLLSRAYNEIEELRDILVTADGYYVLINDRPFADFFQPDWKGQEVLRRAGCYERGSRPGNGPKYLSPPCFCGQPDRMGVAHRSHECLYIGRIGAEDD